MATLDPELLCPVSLEGQQKELFMQVAFKVIVSVQSIKQSYILRGSADLKYDGQ